MTADTPRPANYWPFGISAGLHLTLLIALVLWPASPPPSAPVNAPIRVSLIPIPPKAPVKEKAVTPVPPQTTAPQPAKPETAPLPKPVARRHVVKSPTRTAVKPQARPTQAAVRPTPSPTPTPIPDQLTILRRYPDFQAMTDEQIRALELPPGLKNWDEFAKLAKDIGLFQGAAPPPPTTAGQGAPDGVPNSDPIWSWRDEEGVQIGMVVWWGGKATISWKPGDDVASGLIVPAIPEPSPVPYDLPITSGSDREAVATSVIRILRAFNADGDPDFRPFPDVLPSSGKPGNP